MKPICIAEFVRTHGRNCTSVGTLTSSGTTRGLRSSNRLQNRSGTILVATALVLMALVGLLRLVIDAGQLMTSYRQTQNAADAAAMAAAMDLLNGSSSSTAKSTA